MRFHSCVPLSLGLAFFLKFLFEQVTPIMVITIQRIPSGSQGVKNEERELQPFCHIAPLANKSEQEPSAKPILDR